MKRFTATVRIGKDGSVTGELKGIKGPSCAGKLDFLKDVGGVVKESNTPEFMECEPARVTTTRGS